MAPPTRLAIAKADIETTLSAFNSRVFTKSDLTKILHENRAGWRLAQRTAAVEFIEFLLAKTRLSSTILRAPNYDKEIVRYVWGEASPFALGLSLGPASAYLSHASAIYLHGLTDLIPRQIYVNVEQSPKRPPKDAPTQAAIDRAFRSRQRSTNMIYQLEAGPAILMLSGKATRGLEVQSVKDPTGATVRATSIERTLIDAVVRPTYSGGIDNVFDAFRAARERVSINRLRATLAQLGYSYPYHQAIGFLLERAGYSSARVDLFREMGLSYDFYLAHGIERPHYAKDWRLYVPEQFA